VFLSVNEASVEWVGEDPPDESLRELLGHVRRKTNRSPSAEAITAALNDVLKLLGDALQAAHQPRRHPLKSIQAYVGRDWFLTERGLESFSRPNTLVTRTQLEHRLALRARLAGVRGHTMRDGWEINGWLHPMLVWDGLTPAESWASSLTRLRWRLRRARRALQSLNQR
jgi:hypothetical protein